MDLSSPVTSSKCRSIPPTVAIALSRLTASSNEIDRSGISLSFITYGPMPHCINSRDVDPHGIVQHPTWLVELERLIQQVKLQPGESLRIAIEECRRLAVNDPVQRRHPLLTV